MQSCHKTLCFYSNICYFVECPEIMALIEKRCVGGWAGGVILYLWKMDTLWRGAFKTDMSAGKKDISAPLRSQVQELIHLVHCHVNVPANSTPLCRLSHQDTFIRLWMDRITYSRPLCFRGEEDQTSNYGKAQIFLSWDGTIFWDLYSDAL